MVKWYVCDHNEDWSQTDANKRRDPRSKYGRLSMGTLRNTVEVENAEGSGPRKGSEKQTTRRTRRDIQHSLDLTAESYLGAIHKGRPHREGGGGGSPKADIVREVAWI